MNYKNNIGYFCKSDSLRSVGLGLLIGGFAALCIGFATSYILYVIGTVLLLPGALLFVIGSAGRSGDEEIKHCIARASEGMEVNLADDIHYAKRLPRNTEPIAIEGYQYREGIMLARSKSNSLRSSEYSRVLMYTLTDALYLVCRTFSLVESNTVNTVLEIPYAAIDSIEIFREDTRIPFRKNSFLAHLTLLVITYDGDKVFRTPIHNDITADQLAQRLMKSVNDAKANA